MKKEFEIEPGIIISKLEIKDSDSIILTIDIDKFDVDEAHQIFKIVQEVFPNNSIITTFKGIDISTDTESNPE